MRAINNTTPAHPHITPAPPADTASTTAFAMGLNHNRAASRPEKAPKQSLTHSFTFSTPQNPRNTPGRKRARTLEYPPDGAAAHDDAKVKGGHSLRKRARIDYAQMNDDNEEDQPPIKELSEDQTEITVSGVRSARKRRPTIDPKYGGEEEEEDEEDEGQPSIIPSTKRPRADKQRTVSPKPQRRKCQQRKSTSTTTKLPTESPHQHPSDSELKDTIEVGAPLSMQFTGSSSSQRSETANSVAGHSPSKHNHVQQTSYTGNQLASPTAMHSENGVVTTASDKHNSTKSALKNPQSPHMDHLSDSAIAEFAHPDLVGREDNPAQTSLGQQISQESSPVSQVAKLQFTTQSAQDRAPDVFQSSMVTDSLPESSQIEDQPSSQETVDSDATVDMPPDRPVITSALATQLRDTISSVAEEQSTDRRCRVSQSGTQEHTAPESHRAESNNAQGISKAIPRTRVCSTSILLFLLCTNCSC